MNSHKKIFHKQEDFIPSTEEILNYLNDTPSPNEKGLDEVRNAPSPSPSINTTPLSEKVIGDLEKKNKKKHLLEKLMLSDPLVSDAVEGYALLKEKESGKKINFEIKKAIYSQTDKRDNSFFVVRIAAILIVIFAIAGGSIFLYNQLSSDQIVSVTKEKKVDNTPAISDTVVAGKVNQDTVSGLATETEFKNQEQSKEVLEINNKPISSDGLVYPEDNFSGSINDVDNENTKGPMSSKINNEDEKYENTNIPVPSANRSIVQSDSSIGEKIENDQLAVRNLKKEEKSNVDNSKTKDKGTKKKSVITPRYRDSDLAPSQPSKSDIKSLDDVPTGGDKKLNSLEEGITLYNQGKYKKAKIIFTEVQKTEPSNQKLIFYIGMTNYNLQFYDEAFGDLAKIVSSSSNFYEARWYMSIIYIQKGNEAAAIDIWNLLTKTNNNFSDKAREKLKEYTK